MATYRATMSPSTGKARQVQSFPRLTATFGMPVGELTDAAIHQAIQDHLPEAIDLDWKSALYPDSKDGKAELAKDVAAFANARGGIIVLGVAEDDGRAHRATPVCLTDGETRRMRQICQHYLRPFLPGVSVHPIEIDHGTGFYVITVPRSADSPHAVMQGDRGHLLAYPVRDETQTRWLTEHEIAAYYRRRYAAQTELESTLERVHAEGSQRLGNVPPAWLAVSLAPAIAGNRGNGRQALDAIRESTIRWTNQTPDWFRVGDPKYYVPGVRRAILTGTPGYLGLSRSPHAELHFSGAGFAATFLSPVSDHWKDRAPVPLPKIGGRFAGVEQDSIEFRLLGAISLLIHHAAESGAAGECEVQAQLLLTRPDDTPIATMLFEPARDGHRVDAYELIPGSIAVRKQTAIARATGSLDEIVGSPRGLVQLCYSLATDLVGEFAVADACVLRSDGYLALERVLDKRRSQYEEWATANNLTVQDASR